MARRPVAWVVAIVLLLEAAGVVFVNGVLATVVDNQRMSLAGLDPAVMSTGTWAAGGVSGLYLLLCAAVVVRTAVRDRAPGRWGRFTLIGCAVAHAVLGAVTSALVGWAVFAFLMVVLGMLVLILIAYEPEPDPDPEPASRDEGSARAAA